MTVRMTIEQYKFAENELWGLCLSCNDLIEGGVDGDADDFECESCGEFCVQGIQNAMVEGNVEIVENNSLSDL